MGVTIIIPSLNSPMIDQVLTAVLCQNQADSIDEILVVGKDEKDHQADSIDEILVVGKDEKDLIPKDSRIRFIDTGAPIRASKARNIGITESTSDLLIFLDSDCLPQPDWLSGHLNAHRAGYPIVGGSLLPEGTNYWSTVYNLTLFHEFFHVNPGEERRYLPTFNISVARQVINEVGLMNENLTRGQDIDWTLRMYQTGHTPFFSPETVVFHQHNRTNLEKVWNDCAKSGYYMKRIRLEYPELIAAPFWLKNRLLILLLSPLIAAGVTAKIVKSHFAVFRKQWQTIPAIYVTKLAWCWGARRKQIVV